MIVSIDHIAAPIKSVKAMVDFYTRLGCRVVEEHPAIVCAVYFGNNKINFHLPELWGNDEFMLRGRTAKPGCADLCVVWDGAMSDLKQLLDSMQAVVEEGPVQRVGGRRGGDVGTSVYVRDPDLNLLEFIVYDDVSSN